MKKHYAQKRSQFEPGPPSPLFAATHLLHNKRANYQRGVWRLYLEANLEIENPNQYGWSEEGENLCINWRDCKPGPESVNLFLTT